MNSGIILIQHQLWINSSSFKTGSFSKRKIMTNVEIYDYQLGQVKNEVVRGALKYWKEDCAESLVYPVKYQSMNP